MLILAGPAAQLRGEIVGKVACDSDDFNSASVGYIIPLAFKLKPPKLSSHPRNRKVTRNINLILLSLLLFASFFLATSRANAAIPERPIGYVSDFAHVLNDQALQNLNGYLSHYEQATSNQIFVVIVAQLEGFPIENYSMQLAEKWKVGKKGKDNGILLLIGLDEHKMRIEVGYGLEGKLTDAASGEIIRDVIAPFFRQNKHAEGIFAGLETITQKIDGKSFRGSAVQTQVVRTNVGYASFLVLLFIFVVILVALLRMFGGFGPLLLLSSGSGSGFFVGGGGSGGGGFSGGGFSGGGGGSFGGGGASGGW